MFCLYNAMNWIWPIPSKACVTPSTSSQSRVVLVAVSVRNPSQIGASVLINLVLVDKIIISYPKILSRNS